MSRSENDQHRPAASERAGTDGPRIVVGLGPHGERPASLGTISLSAKTLATARERGFKVSIILHTTQSDWSKRQIDGIKSALSEACAEILEIVDCGYDPQAQVDALNRLAKSKPDAVISIPIGSRVVADAFRQISAAGIALVLLDNSPSGLIPESDYVSVVSCDNFGLGQIAAKLLAQSIPQGGKICVLTYDLDFFVTAQRDLAFCTWMRKERPDIHLSHLKFRSPDRVTGIVADYFESHPDLCGMFIVWDEPAIAAMPVIEARLPGLAVTTVDLSQAVADRLVKGGVLKGVAAQRPYEQGRTAAVVALLALTGNPVPPWIALPGIAVTADNVAEAYQHVGGAPASPELMLGKSSA
jgi:ribose transport system substrate-binding protein